MRPTEFFTDFEEKTYCFVDQSLIEILLWHKLEKHCPAWQHLNEESISENAAKIRTTE